MQKIINIIYIYVEYELIKGNDIKRFFEERDNKNLEFCI